jgi:hypothetical protein
MQQEDAMDKVWAFVKGAALHMGAVGYWANRHEPQPYGLHDFVAENIRHSCGDNARHGFAGRAWADEAPLNASLEDAILAAADYAGVQITPADVEAACLRWHWRNYQWEGFKDLPCKWEALQAAAAERGWIWEPVTPDWLLYEASHWAAEIAAQLETVTA